ncbi:hypothetical protein ACOHX3_000004 [Yersinia enterocolitica]|nr:hypothetical protein [Yersinia enterocolitica]EKN6412522.1 hypothetical protein [Yersinia enterocolitica]ELY5225608.1 hypothetical protein [Yersinia enterocolitica]
MADENTGLVVIDIKPESYPTLYVTNGLDKYLNQIRQAVNEVPDVTTAKGRARIASLAASASRSKTAIEKPGREYLRHLKEQPKIIEAELRRFVIECDEIRDETRRPLTEWEAEQERLKQEAEAKKKVEELAAEIEVAHEMALLMNDAFDRDAKAKADEVERLRKAHEEFIAQQAAEQATREAEARARSDLEYAEIQRRDAVLAQQRAEQATKEAAAKAERDAREIIERAEREKQEAIKFEQLKSQMAEQARLVEEKRIADEAAARAANEAHRKTVGTAVVNGLIEHAGLTREQAIVTLCAIKDSKIPHTNIHY